MPLLLNYYNNEKIAQLCLVILVDLTEEINVIRESGNYNNNKSDINLNEKLNAMVFNLFEYIINNGVIDLITRMLGDASEKLNEASQLKQELKRELPPSSTSTEQIKTENQPQHTEPHTNIETTRILKAKISEMEFKSNALLNFFLCC